MSRIGSALCVEAQIYNKSGPLRITTFNAMHVGRGGNHEEVKSDYGYSINRIYAG